MKIENLKIAGIKAAVVLIPTWLVALVTDKMVFVVPMLAAASFFAGAVELTDENVRRRLDDDTEDGDVDILGED